MLYYYPTVIDVRPGSGFREASDENDTINRRTTATFSTHQEEEKKEVEKVEKVTPSFGPAQDPRVLVGQQMHFFFVFA